MKRIVFAHPERCPTMVLIVAAVFLTAGGCSNQRHAVIASTGTNIGLEIAQNPANQMPQGKLGYNRAELAIVPTNRSSDNAPTGQGNGAADVADVIMEIKFSRIFSDDSGIYQRLAVGKTAVSQAGAAFMFARDTNGEIDPTAAKQLSALYSVSATDATIRAEKAKLSQLYGKVEKAKKDIIEAEVKKIGYGSWDNFSDGRPNEPTFENLTKLKEALKAQGIDID